MSIRKIKLPNGEIRWELRIESPSLGGKRINRRFKRVRDAHAFEEQLKSQDQSMRGGLPLFSLDELNLESEIDFWFQTKSHEIAPSYLKRAEGIARNYLLPQYGHIPPMNFHFGVLQRIRSDLSTKSISPGTINRIMGLIKCVLNHSYLSRRIPSNPTQGFKPLKEIRDNMNFWTRTEAEEFLSFANKKYPPNTPDRWVYLTYLIALNAGLRAGEIFGLKTKDFIENGSVICVRGQFEKVTREYRPCKDRDTRLCPCSPTVWNEVLLWSKYRNLHSSDYLLKSYRNSEKVFDYATFKYKKFDRDIAQSGLKKIRFHDLRHTAASIMISENVDVRTVQEILGHSSLSTTEMYAHISAEKIRTLGRSHRVDPKAISNTDVKMRNAG